MFKNPTTTSIGEVELINSMQDNPINTQVSDDPLDFLKYGYFINLSERVDRMRNALTQFHFLNIPSLKMKKMNAIKYKYGALGCFMSHICCLTEAKKNGYDHIFICEDDIDFTNIPILKQQLRKTLDQVKDWDVLLLSANLLRGEEIPNVDCCIRVTKSTAATGYIVKSHYYDKLLDNFRHGITYLLNNPRYTHLYAIDVYWHSLQKTDKWIIPTPLTVTQIVGYSNIENKLTNYNKIMLKQFRNYKKK